MSTHRPDSSLGAFDLLIDAWSKGRPIVPLFGAGLSANTGIPLTATMVLYLAKVHWLHRGPGSRAATQHLLKHGWPDLHDLNDQVVKKWRSGGHAEEIPIDRRGADTRTVLQSVVELVLRDERLEDEPDRWLVLLQRLCDRKQELKDLFFARLEQGRDPAADHQFAAFLAGLMGWPLILTTNFDTLLETALRSQLLTPTIFEIPEGGRVPDPELVKSGGLSVVKLHGGAYGRLMDESLKQPLKPEERQQLVKYLPEDSLLLVLGYGGGDERVMSLVEDLVVLDPTGFSAKPRMLWIHRDEEPPRSVGKLLKTAGPLIATESYRDGGWFLQELYCRITSSHPVTRTSYRAFPQSPPASPFAAFARVAETRARADVAGIAYQAQLARSKTIETLGDTSGSKGKRLAALTRRAEADLHSAESEKSAIAAKAEQAEQRLVQGGPEHTRTLLDSHSTADVSDSASVIAFVADLPGSGASTRLAQAVERIDGELVWCDLEPFATVDGLVQFLQDSFRRFDPGLPLFSFFQTNGGNLSQIASREPESTTAPVDPRVDYVVRSLRRGRYVVALDSIGEFGRSFDTYLKSPSSDTEQSSIGVQHDMLKKFLAALVERCAEFGESRILLSLTGKDFVETLEEIQGRWGRLIAIDRVQNEQYHAYLMECLARLPAAVPQNPYAKPPEKPSDYIQRIFHEWPENPNPLFPQAHLLKPAFALVSCLRRRRDLVALRRLLYSVVCAPEGRSPTFDDLFNTDRRLRNEDLLSIAKWKEGIGSKERRKIDDFLASMEPLLIRQEGGTYWMHSHGRTAVYEALQSELKERGLGTNGLADLHDLIANYYYSELFWSSNDAMVLFEYVFQRLVSLQTTDQVAYIHRLKDLAGVLSRERDHLLKGSHSGSLLRCIARCNEFALPKELPFKSSEPALLPALTQARNSLRRGLCELEAECCRQASQFQACLEIRQRQVEDRLREVFGEVWNLHTTPDLEEKIVAFKFGPSPGDFEWLAKLLLDPCVKAQPRLPEAFLRLLEHLIEIAHCWCELNRNVEDEEKAIQQLELVRDVCEALLGRPQPGKPNLDHFHVLAGKAPDTDRDHCNDVRIRCAQRLMEAHLRFVCIWRNGTEKTNQQVQRAVEEYALANQSLQEYRGWQDRSYYHYVCFLNTLRARAAYLKQPTPGAGADPESPPEKRFSLAYYFLDDARAAIRQPLKGSSWSAIAIIQLHHVECAMLHANDDFRRAVECHPRPDDNRWPAVRQAAQAKLERAKAHLEQARISLLRGRSHVWAWTWLRILEAQLTHEFLVLDLSDPNQSMNGSSQSATACSDIRCRVQQALAAIRLGLDSCSENRRRSKQLEVLWQQIAICFAVHSVRSSNVDFGEQWSALNAEAGLDRYAKRFEDFELAIFRSHFEPPGFVRSELLEMERKLVKEGTPDSGIQPPPKPRETSKRKPSARRKKRSSSDPGF